MATYMACFNSNGIYDYITYVSYASSLNSKQSVIRDNHIYISGGTTAESSNVVVYDKDHAKNFASNIVPNHISGYPIYLMKRRL